MIHTAETDANLERWTAGLASHCPICLEFIEDESDCDRGHWEATGSPEDADDARLGIAEWRERENA